MRITFLGTGTSIGVPAIGCHCDVCRSRDPRNKRLRSSVYVEAGGVGWVVDTGPDFRTQCLRAGIEHLDAVLYTHGHMDHVAGFDDLRRFTLGTDRSLPIHATPECLADLKRIFSYAFNGENRYFGYIKPEPHEIDGPFYLGDTKVIPLPVDHGKLTTIGYLFERPDGRRAAYISDCKTVPSASRDQMKDLDVLIVDALRVRPHPTHMNLDEALAFRISLGSPLTWFTHFSCEIDHEKIDAGLPKGAALAYDELQIDL